jgi:hypothetical protein
MRTPYGLEIIENCLACPHREERLFCNLSEHAVKSGGDHFLGRLSKRRNSVCRRAARARRFHTLQRPRKTFHVLG